MAMHFAHRPKFIASIAACTVAVVAASGAHAGFVDFDDASFSGTLSSIDVDRYATNGLFFHERPHLVNVAVGSPGLVDHYLASGGTLQNALVLSTSISQTHIDISFFMPGSGEAAMTDSFGAFFHDSNVGTLLGWIEAYGLDGELLGSVSAMTTGAMAEFLALDLTGMHRIRLGTDLDGNMIDNISFGPLYSIPAPGAFALLGVAGLAGGRRRR